MNNNRAANAGYGGARRGLGVGCPPAVLCVDSENRTPPNTPAVPGLQQQQSFAVESENVAAAQCGPNAYQAAEGDRSKYVPVSVLKGKTKTVTVFGSSAPTPGDNLWQEAYRLGGCLAQAGWTVINGGYYGTMEASARGAVDAGGECYGIVVPKVFVERHKAGGGNQYLTGAIATQTLLHRLDVLMHNANVFVVLPGQVGTMQELACVWSEARLAMWHGEDKAAKIFVWRDPWKQIVSTMFHGLHLSCDDERLLTFVDGIDDLMSKLSRL